MQRCLSLNFRWVNSAFWFCTFPFNSEISIYISEPILTISLYYYCKLKRQGVMKTTKRRNVLGRFCYSDLDKVIVHLYCPQSNSVQVSIQRLSLLGLTTNWFSNYFVVKVIRIGSFYTPTFQPQISIIGAPNDSERYDLPMHKNGP